MLTVALGIEVVIVATAGRGEIASPRGEANMNVEVVVSAAASVVVVSA